MAKKETNQTEKARVRGASKTVNIIVAVVLAVALLIIVAITVTSVVKVDPLDKVAAPEYYDFYDIGTTRPMSTNEKAQSKIRSALGGMEFSVFDAIVQWKWDYSYSFVCDENGNKIKMSADEVENKAPGTNEYMVEYVYKPVTIVDGVIDTKTAQSLTVDGETVYFDRLKVVVGNSAGSVGEIRLYPYIYDRVYNKAADDGQTHANYSITAIKVRANTTEAYRAFNELAALINNG